MKLIFFGTGSFAVPALRALREHVCLVVTQPDRPSGRGMKVHSSPMKMAAQELGLVVESPEKSRAPEFVERLRAESADALVVASYGQILSMAVLESAKRGGINLHGSLLPKYRGAAPIQRAILDREPETGITLMQMDKGMDTGDMVAIRAAPIGPDETYSELQDRLAEIAAEMAVEWLPRVVAGDYPRAAQDNAFATMAPKVEKSEAELSFDRSAVEEYARFRAFTPSPGATLKTNVGMLRISRARNWELGTRSSELGTRNAELGTGNPELASKDLEPTSSESVSGVHPPAPLKGGPEESNKGGPEESPKGGPEVVPGTVLQVNPLVISFADGAIQLIELQPEGKKRMSGRDFANGQRLKAGMNLRIN